MENTLKLIGSIQIGQKFYVKNGLLEIDKNPGYIPNIAWRWFTRNNRYNTIDHISDVIKKSFEIQLPISIILFAKDGIDNLMITYKSDKKVCDQLCKIIGFIEYEIKRITHNTYICRNSSAPFCPISFPPSPSCAITVLTGAKGQILSTSLNATNEQFLVGSPPKSSRTL